MGEQKKSRLDDDGGAEVIVIDPDGPHEQALWIRVGPIYYGDKIAEEPAVWIEYQEEYLQSDLQGPVMLSVDTWKTLVAAVTKRIDKFDHTAFGKGIERFPGVGRDRAGP